MTDMPERDMSILDRRQFLATAAAGAAGALVLSLRPTGASAAIADTELAEMTVRQAIAALAAKKVSALEYAEALLARAELLRNLNAFTGQDGDVVRAAARAIDDKRAAGSDLMPLQGVLFVAKDNIDSKDMATTGGTNAFRNWRPAANAPVLQRLIDANGVLLAKTNMHELAFGITSNNAAFGPVRNPYDPTLIPGGSSGGTAAAVAARLAPAGLGSDTGGSCRIPAALCGCVGFRPTLGRYSQTGVIPLSSTRDTVGPFARTVDDVTLIDRLCASEDTKPMDVTIKGLRLGVPRGYFYADLDGELAAVVESALTMLRANGAELVEVDLADIEMLNGAVSFPVVLYEVLRELSAYLYAHGSKLSVIDVVEQVAGPGERGILQSQLGPDAVPAAAYREALAVHRPRLQAAYDNYFADNNLAAMVVPTTPLPARPIGQDETVELNGKQVPTFFTYIRNCDPPSNSGLPCLSVPAGLTKSGLPVGIELVGPASSDSIVLGIGRAYDALRPPLPAPKL